MYLFPIFAILASFHVGTFAANFFFSKNVSNLTPSVQKVTAAETNVTCVGNATAQYMDGFFAALNSEINSSNRVKFLSPAFNFTNGDPAYDSFISSAMSADSWNQLDGYSGNAYNLIDGSTITSYVDRAYGWGMDDKMMVLTETGAFQLAQDPSYDRTTAINQLIEEFSKLGKDRYSSVTGALLFNVFGSNPDPDFTYAVLGGNEINQVCNALSGGSTGCGANSGLQYDPGQQFYSDAAAYNMRYVLSIATASTQPSAIQDAIDRGFIPIIRIGYGGPNGGTSNGFDDPAVYADFIEDIYNNVSGEFYVIVGPNEPLTECWVAQGACGECGTDPASQTVTATFSGTVRTVLPTLNPITGKMQSGAPVRGANIGFYQGRWDTDSGNLYGNVFRTGFVATDGQGRFSKTVSFNGPFDNSAYVFVWCGDNYADGWKMRLDSTNIKKDFFVPCGSNNYSSIKEPYPEFNLSNFGEPLACGVENSITTDTLSQSEIAPGYTTPIILEDPDFDDSFNGNFIDSSGNGLPPSRVTEATIPFPGRNDISQIMSSYSASTKLSGTYGFGRIDPLTKDAQQEDILESCEAINQCNAPIGDSDGVIPRNAQTCYSYAASLSFPGMWEKLYSRSLAVDPPVCLDTSGEEVLLSEIEPPNNLAYLGPDGPFKYTQEDGNYFPYLYLLGDPSVGVIGQGVDEATSDSFTPKSAEISAGARNDPLTSGQDETSQKSWSQNELTAGRPEFSAETSAFLVNSDIAKEDIFGEDAQGENFALGGSFADPFVPFGTGNEALNENIYAVAGNSDYQIGRPYQLCSKNVYDANYDAPLNEFDSQSAGAKTDLWAGGFDYLPDDQGFLEGLRNCLDNLGDCISNFFGFLGGETIDPLAYDTTPVPVEVICPGPTQDTFDSGNRPDGPCVSWQEQGQSFECNPVQGENFCEVASCSLSDGSPCDPDTSDNIDNSAALCADPAFDGTCSYRVPVYTCNCSLRAEFQATHYTPQDVRDFSNADGVLNAGLLFDAPFTQRRACGSLNLINYEVTDQQDQDFATSAFNSGGPGCTEDRLGELLIGTVSDPVFSVFDTDEENEAPEYDGVMTN